MQYLVCVMSPPPLRGLGNNELEMGRKYYVKSYHGDIDSARTVATTAAKADPGVQYAVFAPVEILEALKPAEPKMVHKKINENGEVVIA